MSLQKVNMTVRIPKDLRERARRVAGGHGNFGAWLERVIRAAVESEELNHSQPSFLDAWEKFLVDFKARK